MNLETILHQARNGDRKAFVALMKHMESDMYGMARSILRSNEDCADAMQEAMLKAYKSLGELREPRYFKTWLLRILINECHLIIRKQKRVVPVAEFIKEPSTSGGYEK
ncbi:sigma-70 family RNA polymerase sigma factor, partial [Paenibacillus polymyxa]